METVIWKSQDGAELSRFNSATAVKPWRRLGVESGQSSSKALQFGHGGEAVETERAEKTRRAREQLQFGHGGEAVETVGLSPSSMKFSKASIRPRR